MYMYMYMYMESLVMNIIYTLVMNEYLLHHIMQYMYLQDQLKSIHVAAVHFTCLRHKAHISLKCLCDYWSWHT